MSSLTPEAPAVVRTLPAVWYGSLRDPSGYADEGRAFLLALDRCGYRVAVEETRWTEASAGCDPRTLAVIDRAAALRRPIDDHATIYHLVPYERWRPTGRSAHVCRTMFETDRVPKSFLPMLAACDAVWVPTEFNVETFQNGGVPGDRLRVLPGTLDFDLFDPAASAFELPGRRSFAFLTLFDFTDRKGWDVLLDAWADAFDPDDDVCLVLKCLSLHHDERTVRRRIADHLDGRPTAPVIVRTDVLAAPELPRLYAAVDAFVLASRGEGWGRPYMEAMAMGLPTIGSRWSANLAFMNDGNSWLVDGEVVKIPSSAQQHTPIYRGQRWFAPDREALAARMREVASGGAAASERAAGARSELIERFGPDIVAPRIAELVDEAVERLRWRESRPIACTWRGEWGGIHSLAVVNDGITSALERAGLHVQRAATVSGSVGSEVGIAQQWPPSFEAPSSGPFVLAQPWEYGAVPAAWLEQIRAKVDEVWACSSAVRDAYVASGISPELVHVVPCGVDLDEFSPDGERYALPPAATTFLFVGGTVSRKGVDLLLEAYRRAFGPADDVLLVVKDFGTGGIYRGDTSGSLLERFRAASDTPPLHVIDDELPRGALPSLYRAADVVVQPYRGEGFCLPALEALACGVPVIVTDGGPTDDFVDPSCSWRIPSVRVAVAPDAPGRELLLAREGFMRVVELDRLAAALREAVDPAVRSAKAVHARDCASALSWDRVATIVAERLQALAGRRPVRELPRGDVPGRRGTLFACLPEWEDESTWLPAVLAYLDAFTPADDVTLALPTRDVARDQGLVVAALEAAGRDLARIPDLALADALETAPESLVLAADAVLACLGRQPVRARCVLDPEPAALTAFVAARQEGE